MASIVAPSLKVAADAARLIDQIVGAWRTQALRVAIEIGAIDELAAGMATASNLARSLTSDEDGLTRLLRALCALGVCAEEPPGRFSITDAGRLLSREGVGGQTLRAMALWWGGPMWTLWQGLDYSVRSGYSVRERLTGEAHYRHLENATDDARVFHEAMRAMTALVSSDVAALPLWRDVHHVVDVGGGHGQLALAVLQAQPHLRATVLDRPHAELGARAQIQACGLAARCEFARGSFFETLPRGADAYLLKSILHNWPDDEAGTILARCRDAAEPGTSLLLVERIRPERLRPQARDDAVARTDLNMLAGLGGRERTLQEFDALLRAHGFEPMVVHETAFELSVLQARAVALERR